MQWNLRVEADFFLYWSTNGVESQMMKVSLLELGRHLKRAGSKDMLAYASKSDPVEREAA